MRNESVAILDIRSNEVAFLLGSKGVNETFVFRGTHTEQYEGFSVADGFFDEESFRRAVSVSVTSVRQNYEGAIDEVYIGVPSAFVSILTKGHTNSYPSKRKISPQDIETLYESGLNELLAQGQCIRRSAMYFTLGDNRKYFTANDLYGVPTTMLKGALCYYFVKDEFYEKIAALATDLGFSKIYFIPSTVAQAEYLFSQKKREGYAFLLDIGFLTTSISVIYGNGIVHEETFDCGVGEILAAIATQFNVEYDIAEEILKTANISGGTVDKRLMWTSEQEDVSFPIQTINDIIKYVLDGLCENVERFFGKYYHDKVTTGLTVNPIGITGEGIAFVKGATEHVSRRLNRLTEIVFPDLPYYDKPTFSSRISLLSAALSEREKHNWLYKIFNYFGGKRKW